MVRLSDLPEQYRWPVLAWFIAGEGDIGITCDSKARLLIPAITISQRYREPLDQIQSSFGGKVYRGTAWNGRNYPHWYVHRHDDVSRIARGIIPFLPLKSEQARLILEFCLSRLKHRSKNGSPRHATKVPYSPREWEIRHQIYELNMEVPDPLRVAVWKHGVG